MEKKSAPHIGVMDVNSATSKLKLLSIFGHSPFDGNNEERERTEDVLREQCDIHSFLRKNQKSPVKNGNNHIYGVNDEFTVVVRGRMVFGINNFMPQAVDAGETSPGKDDIPAGVILVGGKRTKALKDYRLLILQNGDTDEGDAPYPEASLVGELGAEFPTVSFTCLGRFYGKASDASDEAGTKRAIKRAINKLNNGELILVDYTPDEHVELTDSEKKKYLKWRADRIKNRPPSPPITPPDMGLTLINMHNVDTVKWHRSATVVLLDKKTKMCMLFGQDEGSYFGCELPGEVETVGDAYDILAPAAVKKNPLGVKRQGEWFALPFPEDKVPEPENCIALFNADDCEHGLCLPRAEGANSHFIETEDGRILKDGTIIAKSPKLVHRNENNQRSNEHQDMAPGLGWYTFCCNTAKRSYSVTGVD